MEKAIGRTSHCRELIKIILSLVLFLATSSAIVAQNRRARDLGIPLDGIPGDLNAITDVRGVEVGQVTLISGEGKLIVGKGPVRTGVTAILPRGKKQYQSLCTATGSVNGNIEKV